MSGPSPFPYTPGTSPSAAEWIDAIERLLAEEQPFVAFDLCARARAVFPHDADIALLGVLAQLRGHSSGAALKAFAGCSELLPPAPERKTRELLAEIHRLSWEQLGQLPDLQRAQRLYGELYHETRRPEDGVLAAAMGWRLGARDETWEIAQALAAQCAAPFGGEDAEAGFHRRVHTGHAALLLNRPDEALEAYREAGEGWRGDYRPVVAALKQVRLLEGMGITVPTQVSDHLRPPRIVIFGGQPIDPPGLEEAILPPAKEAALKAAIEAQLRELDARIGYSGAACGSDLLFIEAMVARGAEVHVVLPCALQDFIEARVAYAGGEWRQRFEAALKQATSVTHATHERYLGHAALLRYANNIITGMGWLRAALLLTEPHLLTAWDFRAGSEPGSPADFMDHWPDITTLHLIELDELEEESQGTACAPTAPAYLIPQEPQRLIRAMLFADVVGYSKMGEEFLPAWFKLLEKVKELLDATGNTPDLVEAWGDAFYIVMPTARHMLSHAFQLREAFRAINHRDYGLPMQLNVRIGLHSGPVFTAVHPVTGRSIYSGRQVNRAARIEPITMPGEVYASQEFVALLTAEENAVRHELAFRGEHYAPWFRAEYLGVIEMPKKHGNQQIYHLLPAVEVGAI